MMPLLEVIKSRKWGLEEEVDHWKSCPGKMSLISSSVSTLCFLSTVRVTALLYHMLPHNV